MKTSEGFTLIELILFIVISTILATTIMLAFSSALNNTPTVRAEVTANQWAEQCMEWLIGQRRLLGYSTLAVGTTVPSYCSTNLPSGYSLAVNIATTTINTDTNFKTITVTVSGTGNATLTTLIANY